MIGNIRFVTVVFLWAEVRSGKRRLYDSLPLQQRVCVVGRKGVGQAEN